MDEDDMQLPLRQTTPPFFSPLTINPGARWQTGRVWRSGLTYNNKFVTYVVDQVKSSCNKLPCLISGFSDPAG